MQALTLCRGYAFETPLHLYLKEQFRSRKQMGARDRRWMRELVYCWYRPGNSLVSMTDEQRLLVSFFLSHTENDQLSEIMSSALPEINFHHIKLPSAEKMSLVKAAFPAFDFSKIFPFADLISQLLDLPVFEQGLLVQPKVWLRLQRGKKAAILEQLNKAAIPYSELQDFPDALSVAPQAALHTLDFMLKGWAEVQDLSSQQTGSLYHPKTNEHWYDCCAASGGKSLLLKSMESSVRLTVSDNRESILTNLRERFRKTGLRTESSFVADLSVSPPSSIPSGSLDGIIADVPCTGSGTWSRSPEQIQIFKKEDLLKYTTIQQAILRNVNELLKPGKPLIYSTCSVFHAENEAIVEYAEKELGLKCEVMNLFQGTKFGADTLFAARLIR